MKLHFYFNKLNRKQKEFLEEYITVQKLKRLTRLLQKQNPDLNDLKIYCEYFEKHTAFLIKLDLKTEKSKFLAEERSHGITKAFDLSLDRLVAQLRKAKI